jgi:hypothetical protein
MLGPVPYSTQGEEAYLQRQLEMIYSHHEITSNPSNSQLPPLLQYLKRNKGENMILCDLGET